MKRIATILAALVVALAVASPAQASARVESVTGTNRDGFITRMSDGTWLSYSPLRQQVRDCRSIPSDLKAERCETETRRTYAYLRAIRGPVVP